MTEGVILSYELLDSCKPQAAKNKYQRRIFIVLTYYVQLLCIYIHMHVHDIKIQNCSNILDPQLHCSRCARGGLLDFNSQHHDAF